MKPKNNYLTYGILVLAIIGIIFISGCVQQTETPSGTGQQQTTQPTEPPKPKLSTLEPFELVLQTSDFPSNYTIKERTERVKSDVSQDAIDLGWEKGYYVRYARIGDSILDATVIEQAISVYPIDNISKVLTLPRESNENITFDELSNPNIGDDSRAFRITTKDEFGTETRYYQIEFVKMDVYESLYMSGTTTDYELLKDLSKKAETKIR